MSSKDFDIPADYSIRDTNVTQQSGAGRGTANLVDKVIAQKQRIQPDATLCTEYKKRKAPPKGFEDVSNHRGNEEFSTGADTDVTQLADLKALLSSLDPTILKQLLAEILKD